MLGKKRNDQNNKDHLTFTALTNTDTPQPQNSVKKNDEPLTISDENEIFEIIDELSSEKILEKQEKIKELSKQLKEIEREKEEINKELNKGNKFKELQESFNKSKNEFVFKVHYDNDVFYESSAKNYLTAIIKNMAKQQGIDDIKINQFKTLQNYLWFKLSEKMVIKWLYKRIDGKGDRVGFLITQLRSENFFNDI